MPQQMISEEGYCPFRGHRTWYRVTGDLRAGPPPLIVAHGGPGCTHDYVDAYRAIAETGRAVVHYDQLGNGRSTHLPEAGAEFWTVELFLDELDTLLDHLGLRDRYCLLGQSWGGMLAAEHAVRRPAGLKGLVIANSPSSFPTWVEEALRLRRELPGGVHEAAPFLRGDLADLGVCRQLLKDRDTCRLGILAFAAQPGVEQIAARPVEAVK
ncbi:alpha/beta fold hydrolase [Pseudooceanicola sp. 200-1SW]|uniref:alpha/beta fold hydrolase n=1 Tax=Pseudooceanicola sp. 200-1SW TaxID=3425949 RepID=UPI003D7FAECB